MSDQPIRTFDVHDHIKTISSEIGLQYFGATNLDVTTDAKRYRRWIAESRHGSMEWMSHNLEIRDKPALLLTGAKSVLVFGFSYYLGDRWNRGPSGLKPVIAQYARLKDYHHFLRQKVLDVQRKLESFCDPNTSWRVCVDSAPVLERALAFKTGQGFIGKNTCFISPAKGSFILLAELFTTWQITDRTQTDAISSHDERTANGGCGSCRRCQVHCPTGALDQDYRIDSRKCLSYWTIEHRGLIPLPYWPWIGRYIFGCDICQLVCPYNRRIEAEDSLKNLIRFEKTPDLISMVTMDQIFYEKTFGGTPLTRAKISGLRRNALIAAVVTGDERVFKLLEALKTDGDPVVSGTAQQVEEYQIHHQSIGLRIQKSNR